jgi:hypothetical protein
MTKLLFLAIAWAAAAAQAPSSLTPVVLTVGTQVTGETATRGSAGWTLAHTPAAAPVCYLNGLRLTGGSADFTIAGSAITSYWFALTDSTDVLACDYRY